MCVGDIRPELVGPILTEYFAHAACFPMNRIYRLVLSRATSQWMPVSETTRGAAKGRRPRRGAASRRKLVALGVLAVSLDHAGWAHAAPTGAQITGGTGTVTQTGNTTTIRQTSTDLFLDWQSFNVAANQVVDFVQPGATSIAVNRILGNTASQIFGHLDANGQVWLINPNGILFGRGAEVDVGGLTASTLDLNDASFNSSLRRFSGSGTGSVVNQGTIQSADGGYVALLGNQVSNQGVIRAHLGTVALGAGSAETLTFNGRQLIHLRVDQSTLNDLAANGQLIEADGGHVIMTAGAQDSLLASAVNNSGVVQARSVANHAGTITLLAGMTAGRVDVGGTLDATAPAGESGGSIETSGASVSVASTARIAAGPGGSWRIDPINLTIDAAAATAIDASLNSGTSVTEATTATTASGSGTQSAGAGDIDVNAAIAWTSPVATLTLTAYHAINVNAPVTGAGALVMQAGSGNLTLAAGTSIDAATGMTLGTGANFVNLAGANALGATGSWQLYSTNPTLNTLGGLTPAFIQYAAAFGATADRGGNGLLYSVAPAITVSALHGTASKPYDGGTAAALTASNYTASGTLNGDAVTAMSAAYQTANAGSSIPVTSPATAANLTITSSGGLPVYGYGIAGSPVTASIGVITRAPLSAAIVGDTGNPGLSKVYDGTTTATLNSGNYQLSGFVSGQSASVNQPSSVAYASATAGTETLNATFAATNFVAGSGTNLSNYTLPTTATASGTVSPAPLVVTGVLATGKVYDSTTSDVLNTTNAGLYGVIGSDSVSLSSSGATGTFSSPNVGNNLSVATGGFTLSGAQHNDYQLIAPAGLTANITAAPLSITGVAAAGKVYDGNAVAALVFTQPQLSGLLGADAATVVLSYANASAAFPNPNVGASLPVTTMGFAISGTHASDYDLAQVSGLTAAITRAPLTVTLIGDPTKPYNGTTTAALSSANFDITGFVAGEGASIPQTSLAEYSSANAGARTVTATLAVTDFSTTGSTLLSNYSVPTGVTGSGTISPAPLTGMLVGNPTKVYDATASAALTNANYVFTGFLTGQGVTVNQTSGLYASANAGLEPVTATLATGNYTGTGGTLLSNYSLPTTLTGTGTITQAPLAGYVYAGITGNPTKPYDGSTSATLTSSNFVLTGFAGSDGATVSQTVGQYASPNAGLQTVSAALTTPDFTATGSTILANYTLPTSAYGSGTILPAVLSVTVINDPTRVYNGSTGTVLLSSNYSITGFASGQGAVINPSALINYGSANVGSQSITAALTPSAYTANGGTLLSNYVLASSATGTGNITPAPVYVTGVFATSKVYDTTPVDPLSTGAQALAGVVSTDAANISLTGTAAGAFGTTQVGTALPVSVSGLSIVGTAASNYSLQAITGLAANITPAPLTITGVSANSKPYDGSTLATLNTSSDALVGVYSGDVVTLSAAGAVAAFTSVNVGSNLKVTASGFTIGGAAGGDYALAQPSGLSANIVAAPITAQITGNPTKVYDGSASTTLVNADYTLLGFATVGGVTQGATVPQSATASYGSPDAGTGVAIGSTLVLSDFVALSGTNLSNYALPTVGTGTGTITQAPLTATLIGTPTKLYDGTATASLAPANFQLSGFIGSQSATVTQTAGSYASANAGSEAVTAALTSGNYSPGSGTTLANYALPASATGPGSITRAPLTVLDVMTTPQPYDGTTTDALTGATLTGTTYGSDAPVLTNFATGRLGSSGNAGTDTVTTTMGLSGTGSGNYSLSQPTGLTAVISPVQLSATSSVSKTYDGTTSASLSGSNTTFTGFVGSNGATVNAGVTGTFAVADVGSGIAVSAGALTTGNLTATGSTLLSNYVLPISDNGSGAITPATLTYTASPSSQQYGLTPTGLAGSVTGFVDGQTLATATSGTAVFATTATGASSVGHYAIDGNGLAANNGDYVFAQAAGNATALTLTPAPLTVSGVQTTSRLYDGTTVDALSGAALSGVIYNNDVLTLTNSGSGTLGSSGNAGTDAVTTSMGLSGARSGNYALTQETGLSADISALALTAVSSVTRVYDGTTVANLSGANTVISGFLTGQGATVNAGVTGTFADPNVAGGIGITGAGLTAGNLTPTGGALLANYTLPASDNGSGTITPAIVNLSGTRAYDGLLDASAGIFGNAGTVNGVDGQTLVLSGSGTLAGRNVATLAPLPSLTGLSLGNGTGLASNYQLTGGIDTVTVTPLAITVSGTANDKPYDGTTAATLSGLGSSGVFTGDSVQFADTAASFNSKYVAAASTVTISGITDSGADAGNYTLLNTTATTGASITPLAITVLASGIDKVYDGGVSAAVTLSGTGVLSGDSLLFADTSATFANRNAASAVPVSVAGITASGTGSGNYTVNATATTTANITPLPITVTAGGIDKVYDGGVTAAVTLASSGVLGGDSVTFADSSATFATRNVANGLVVSVSGITDGGSGAGNYTVNATAATTADITPAVVNLSGSRSYDGGLDAAANLFGTAGTVNGVAGETLVLTGSGILANRNVGVQSASPGTLALGNGTGLAGNYQLTGGSDLVTVTPLAITVAGTADNKTYDGTTAATLSGLGSGGVLPGDSVAFSAAAASFADRNVGNGKTVTIYGITDVGADAGNYRINTSAITTANITPATLTETATPVTVAAGQVPTLSGSVSGFVPGDTRANSSTGTLVWASNAPIPPIPGTYAIDGSGLLAENYVLVQSPANAAALTIGAAPEAIAGTTSGYGLFDIYLAPAAIATPYGVGSSEEYGNNTGNARRDTNPVDGNRHLSDFTGHLALGVIGAGIRLPAAAAN